MKKSNKKYAWGIGALLLVLVALGGYFTWQYYFTACCEPPLEVIQMQTESSKVSSFTGDWTYFTSDAEGYSTGINLVINQVDNKVAGEFSVVWSFPKAPAARLNNGTFQGGVSLADSNLAEVKWIGSRDDSGTAELRFNAQKDAIVWKAKTSVVADLTMPDNVTLYRNRWPELSHDEQNALVKATHNALEQIPGMEIGEIFAEDAIVIRNRAALPFVSNDGENSGTLYLEKKGDVWEVIPDPPNGDLSAGL